MKNYMSGLLQISLIGIMTLLPFSHVFPVSNEDIQKLITKGTSELQSQNLDDAEKTFLSADNLLNKTADTTNDLSWTISNMLGSVYLYKQNLQKSRVYYEKALQNSENLNSIYYKAESLNNLAICSYHQGLFLEAKDYFKSAGDTYILSGYHDKAGFSYFYEGLSYYALRDYSTSSKVLIKTVETLKNSKSDSAFLTQVFYYTAVSLQQNFQYNEAMKYYDMVESASDSKSIDLYIGLLIGRGDIYQIWGDYNRALGFYLNAKNVSEEYQYYNYYMKVLLDIGNLYIIEKNYTDALTYIHHIYESAEKTGQTEYIISALNSLGIIYLYQKDYEKSLNYYKQAYTIAVKTINHFWIHRLSVHLAGVYERLNKTNIALEYYKKADAGLKASGQIADRAVCLSNMGNLYTGKKQYNKAIHYLEESIALKESIRRTANNSSKRDFIAAEMKTYQMLVNAYGFSGKYKQAVECLEKSRVLSMKEEMGVDITITAESLKGYQKTLSPDEAVLYFNNVKYENPIIYYIDKNNITGILLNHYKLLTDIQKSIGVITNKNREETRSLKLKSDNEKIIPIVADLSNLISYYRTLLTQPDASDADSIRLKQISRKMYDFYLRPLSLYLTGKKKIHIIPDGSLSFLPFETLMDRSEKYLCEKIEVSYIHSLSIQTYLNNRNYTNNNKKILAFGNADYTTSNPNADSDRKDSEILSNYYTHYFYDYIDENKDLTPVYYMHGIEQWTALPGTLDEVNRIKSIEVQADIITGKNATETTIKNMSDSLELQKYRIIHFATHGVTIDSLPDLSAIVMSQNQSSEPDEDGYLTVKEIKKLNIASDFINLSACDTGLGKDYGNEGISGLTQAFLVAGSNSVAVSLWKVSDKATGEFMSDFYNYIFNEKYTYKAALQKVKINMIHSTQYSHPYYWAPFVYYGK